jgi:hypothetical protein
MNGFIVGVFTTSLVFIILTFIPGTKIQIYDDAIKACEKNLPRTQTCVITAIPKPMED